MAIDIETYEEEFELEKDRLLSDIESHVTDILVEDSIPYYDFHSGSDRKERVRKELLLLSEILDSDDFQRICKYAGQCGSLSDSICSANYSQSEQEFLRQIISKN